MEEFLNYLAREGRVVRDAPVAFAVGVALAGALIWWVLDLRYSDRLDTLRERLAAEADASATGLLEVGLAMPAPGSPHFVLTNVGQKPIRWAVEDMLIIEDEKVIPFELREVTGRLTSGSKKDVFPEPRLSLIRGKDEYYIDMHVTVRYGLEGKPYSQLIRNRRLCRIKSGMGECKVLLEKDYTIAVKSDE